VDGHQSMIRSVEIANFRCFKQLDVVGLKQFNFIVGDSGSGKTAFLEALFLLGGANPEIWMRLRQWRGAGNVFRLTGMRSSYESLFRDIFFDFKKAQGANIKQVDSNGLTRSLSIRYPNQDRYTLAIKGGHVDNPMLVNPIAFTWKVRSREYKSSVDFTDGVLKFTGFNAVYPAWFSSPAINDAALIGTSFSELSVRKKTESLLRAVQILFPYVADVSLENLAGEPTLCVSLESISEKLPIGSISSGLNRFLSIMIAIAANPGGVLLIDEFEVGFYYKTLPKLLETIFTFCEEHQVQIVSTTHSYAFLQAMLPLMKAQEEDKSEFLLLRSERKKAGCIIKVLGDPASAIEAVGDLWSRVETDASSRKESIRKGTPRSEKLRSIVARRVSAWEADPLAKTAIWYTLIALPLPVFDRCYAAHVEDGVEETAGFIVCGRELSFEPITQPHQFIHFGDDAVLFGKRW
jgi:hypothetical protein